MSGPHGEAAPVYRLGPTITEAPPPRETYTDPDYDFPGELRPAIWAAQTAFFAGVDFRPHRDVIRAVQAAAPHLEQLAVARVIAELRAQADSGGEDWPLIAADWLAERYPS